MRVLGFHFIVTGYGFWLPNDPRGSWSDVIRQLDLLVAGRATKIDSTRSVADRPHDHAGRTAAKRALKYPPVRLTGRQAREAVRGMGAAVDQAGYVIHAVAVLPDHIHWVMGWHSKHVDEIAKQVKAKMTAAMNAAGMHPMAKFAKRGRTPSPWARNYWCPFIRDADHMRTAIAYVESNPIQAGLRPQRWSVVQPFDG